MEVTRHPGLGSSAAMSVCLSAGLFLLHSTPGLVRGAEVTLATRPPHPAPQEGSGPPLCSRSSSTHLSEEERAVVCGWAYTAEQVE